MANAKPPQARPETPTELRESAGRPSIIVLGASARACAASTMRSGFTPHACDLFGDADLRAQAVFHGVVEPYPIGFENSLRTMPEAPFVYTGGLENHPELVDRLSRIRPLWGNSGFILRAARDPVALAEAMHGAGASPPETRRGNDPPRNPEGWLQKPLRGAGGNGIQPVARALPKAGRSAHKVYFQRHCPGLSCSAVYAALGERCDLLGATRQLIGEEWLGAQPFAWCGNVGPLTFEASVQRTLEACGRNAMRSFGLLGLFGIDFLLDGAVVQPVEINPRYPASTEVLELALGLSAMRLQAQAFGHEVKPTEPLRPRPGVVGKAIIFATRTGRARGSNAMEVLDSSGILPAVADIPLSGSILRKGSPVCTVLAQGEDEADCLQSLRAQQLRVLRLLGPGI